MTVLADGSYVVAWQSAGQDGDGTGIYAQRYTAGGQKLGGEFRVNSVTAGSQTAPSTVALADGGFEVVWLQGYYQVYGQRYDANGAAVGSQITYALDGYIDSGLPKAVQLANGTMLIVWGGVNTVTNTLAYGQLFDSLGTAIGSRFTVSTYRTGTVDYPSIAALADGGFIATWSVGEQNGDVYAQRFDASGNTVGGYFMPTPTSVSTDRLAVSAGLKDGGFVIVWQASELSYTGNSSGIPYDIYAQRYDASGNTVGGKIRVNSYTTGDESQPSVVATADGGYMVAWRANAEDGSGYGIYAQRYDANNVAVGGEVRLNDTTAGDQNQPALAVQADGAIIASWASQTANG
ncbi:RTX toxin, partial [Nitrospirillum amazonense]|nr:RTX toxin [Nitrospirillum amazonense]